MRPICKVSVWKSGIQRRLTLTYVLYVLYVCIIYIYTYLYVYVSIYIYIYICIYKTYTYIYIYIYIYVSCVSSPPDEGRSPDLSTCEFEFFGLFAVAHRRLPVRPTARPDPGCGRQRRAAPQHPPRALGATRSRPRTISLFRRKGVHAEVCL